MRTFSLKSKQDETSRKHHPVFKSRQKSSSWNLSSLRIEKSRTNYFEYVDKFPELRCNLHNNDIQ